MAKEKPKEKLERENQLALGELLLTSTELSIYELIAHARLILTEPIFLNYLDDLSKRKLLGLGKSYIS